MCGPHSDTVTVWLPLWYIWGASCHRPLSTPAHTSHLRFYGVPSSASLLTPLLPSPSPSPTPSVTFSFSFPSLPALSLTREDTLSGRSTTGTISRHSASSLLTSAKSLTGMPAPGRSCARKVASRQSGGAQEKDRRYVNGRRAHAYATHDKGLYRPRGPREAPVEPAAS